VNKDRRHSYRNAALAAATLLTLLAGSVLAENIPEVTVQATRIVNAKITGRSASGIPITDLSVSYGVSLAGLNLATNSGAVEAQRRVSEAAMAACKEIGRQYPDATPSDDECAKAAAAKSAPTLHQLIAAAEKAAQK